MNRYYTPVLVLSRRIHERIGPTFILNFRTVVASFRYTTNIS
nr:MAG TPA: hypothetical protein [Caudoviricetes sp.]